MADGDNNHPQPLWTGFRRFFDPPQKTDGFRTCIILNPYGFGTDSPLHVNDDNYPYLVNQAQESHFNRANLLC